MKKMNNLKKLAFAMAVGASMNASAADFNAGLAFDTLPAITISEIRAMDFGAVLSLTQAATCAMSADSAGGTETLTDTQLGVNIAAYNNSGELTGGCTGNGTVGIYEVSSYSGAAITVSVTAGTATDIAFVPSGFAVDHNGGGAATGETLGVGTDADVEAANAITAFTQAGVSRVVVGGTITNQVALTADGTYNTDFNLDVVYQ